MVLLDLSIPNIREAQVPMLKDLILEAAAIARFQHPIVENAPDGKIGFKITLQEKTNASSTEVVKIVCIQEGADNYLLNTNFLQNTFSAGLFRMAIEKIEAHFS